MSDFLHAPLLGRRFVEVDLVVNIVGVDSKQSGTVEVPLGRLFYTYNGRCVGEFLFTSRTYNISNIVLKHEKYKFLLMPKRVETTLSENGFVVFRGTSIFELVLDKGDFLQKVSGSFDFNTKDIWNSIFKGANDGLIAGRYKISTQNITVERIELDKSN